MIYNINFAGYSQMAIAAAAAATAAAAHAALAHAFYSARASYRLQRVTAR